jgi:hypothetical protein
VHDADGEAVQLHYTSPEGEEVSLRPCIPCSASSLASCVDTAFTPPSPPLPLRQGYPGTLHVSVTYRLSRHANELSTCITAVTDEATPGEVVRWWALFGMCWNLGSEIWDLLEYGTWRGGCGGAFGRYAATAHSRHGSQALRQRQPRAAHAVQMGAKVRTPTIIPTIPRQEWEPAPRLAVHCLRLGPCPRALVCLGLRACRPRTAASPPQSTSRSTATSTWQATATRCPSLATCLSW